MLLDVGFGAAEHPACVAVGGRRGGYADGCWTVSFAISRPRRIAEPVCDRLRSGVVVVPIVHCQSDVRRQETG